MDIAALTQEYLATQAAIARVDALAKQKKSPLTDRLAEIESEIHQHLKADDLTAVKIQGGEWSRKTSLKYNIKDKDKFADFLVDRQASHGDAGDFIMASIIKAKADAMAEANELPDFVGVFSEEKISFKAK